MEGPSICILHFMRIPRPNGRIYRAKASVTASFLTAPPTNASPHVRHRVIEITLNWEGLGTGLRRQNKRPRVRARNSCYAHEKRSRVAFQPVRSRGRISTGTLSHKFDMSTDKRPFETKTALHEPGTDWIAEAKRCISPNQDTRPDQATVDLLVIHNISLPPGNFGGPWIQDLFLNDLDTAVHPYFASIAGLCVSSHFLIRRDGELLQFVPMSNRAWHAGTSCFDGREACNDFSIGIELEGSDDTPFTHAQYLQLAKLAKQIMLTYPAITSERIVGHSDIAPGRKTDPGPFFDWQRLRGDLSKV